MVEIGRVFWYAAWRHYASGLRAIARWCKPASVECNKSNELGGIRRGGGGGCRVARWGLDGPSYKQLNLSNTIVSIVRCQLWPICYLSCKSATVSRVVSPIVLSFVFRDKTHPLYLILLSNFILFTLFCSCFRSLICSALSFGSFSPDLVMTLLTAHAGWTTCLTLLLGTRILGRDPTSIFPRLLTIARSFSAVSLVPFLSSFLWISFFISTKTLPLRQGSTYMSRFRSRDNHSLDSLASGWIWSKRIALCFLSREVAWSTFNTNTQHMRWQWRCRLKYLKLGQNGVPIQELLP